jgi:rifampin ADP-ribosylating transferase
MMPAHVWKAALKGLYEATPPTEAGMINAPTLILYGGLDSLLPPAHQEEMAARIPGAELKVYPDVGHLVLWECPELVADDARAFLLKQ